MADESSQPRRLAATRAAAFAIPAAVVLYYALRSGSYDIVPRQEEALVVWCLIGLGFALGLLPRARPPGGMLVPLGALALLTAWTAASLSWTSSDERTLAEVARVLHFTGIAVLLWSVLDARTWRPAAAGLAAGAVVVSCLAATSRLAPGAFSASHVREVLDTNRLSYPFDYWNAVAAWGAMTIAIALAWGAHARLLAVRLACAAALPVCALAVYFTYSRTGALGAAGGVAIVLLLARNRWVAVAHLAAAGAGAWLAISEARDHQELVDATGGAGAGAVVVALALAAAIGIGATLATWFARGDRRWRLPQRAGRASGAAAIAVLLLLALTVGSGRIADAWDEFRQGEDTAAEVRAAEGDPADRLASFSGNRYNFWSSALDAFEEKPLKGIGPGTFEFWWNRDGGEEFLRDAHSAYLEHLAELGVPGFLFIVVALGSLAVLGVRRRFSLRDGPAAGAQAALLAGFGVFVFTAGVDWMWESTAVAVLGISAGAVAAVAGATRARRGGPPPVPLRAGLALLALLAALVQLPGLVSTSRVRDSQNAFSAGDLRGAENAADDAIETQPWAASPYVQRGLVAEATGNLRGARADILRAIEREPLNWRHSLLFARIEAKRGDADAALAAYRRARTLRPHADFFERPE